MRTKKIETHAHTTNDGTLNLSVNVGMPNVDMAVVVHVTPLAPDGATDEKGWPLGFFERVAGSMPELERAPQGDFEKRLTLE